MSDFVDGATTPVTDEGATTPVEETSTPVTAAVDEWVGEGKKYKSVDDLANAYKSADQRLEELKLETERLASEKKEISDKAKGVEDVLAAIQSQTSTTTQTTTPVEVTPPDLDALIADKMAEQKAAETKTAKVEATWSMMDEAFGSRSAASLAVSNYMGDDPARKELVNSMAVTDPAGLMKLIGKDLDKKVTTFTSDHSNGGGEVNLEGTLTWETAQQIRKKDPKMYYSHAFKQRMLNEIPRT